MKTTRIITALTLGATGVLAAALACSQTTSPGASATLYGPTVSFGQGTARTWVQTDAQSKPVAVGIAMSESALNGLPTTVSGASPTAIMATLPLPTGIATGYDHAEIGWNPNGHEPAQLYGAPHFDLHFYMITSAAQMAILPNDPQFATKAATLPSGGFVPTGYVPPPAPVAANAVPQMGVHWTSVQAPEVTGHPFTNTFIYGSWNGEFVFLEPMVTKAYLQTHPNATAAVAQPTQWAMPGYYPTTYRVTYDAPSAEYRFALGALVPHGM